MFLVLLKWEVAAILRNGYGVHGQNYVAWLQGSEIYWWEVGEVGRWKGGKGMRLQEGKDGRMVRWEGGRFLVLFKGWEHRVSPKFYLFVSDVNQGNEGVV